MTSQKLNVLIISDLHFVEAANHTCTIEKRKTSLGLTLFKKALLRLKHQGIQPDLLIILGDVVDDGLAEGAEKDLATIAAAARETNLPVLAVPGNHDEDASRFARIFNCQPGLHQIGGYGFIIFQDSKAENSVTTRSNTNLAVPQKLAAENPDLPLITLQHNPVFPPIESSYPYVLQNAAEIIESYRRANVLLSLSGHYHRGQGVNSLETTTFYTVPAVCQAPFGFAHLKLNGRDFKIREINLEVAQPSLIDVHCHTEFAYCGTTVSAAKNIDIARNLGLERLCLTEHTFQLYFAEKEAWRYNWQTDLARVNQAWQNREGRMETYKKFAGKLRSDFVRLGIEVDLLADGRLLLAGADRDGWDLRVGAIHNIPGFVRRQTSQSKAERLFMRDVERLVQHPIDVLAHPFRFFRRMDLQIPAHLYTPVAELLAENGVAAEINFHTNNPDPRFVEICLAHGVKIALGSDSHDLAEVAEFWPHLNVLKQAGVTQDFSQVLFTLD